MKQQLGLTVLAFTALNCGGEVKKEIIKKDIISGQYLATLRVKEDGCGVWPFSKDDGLKGVLEITKIQEPNKFNLVFTDNFSTRYELAGVFVDEGTKTLVHDQLVKTGCGGDNYVVYVSAYGVFRSRGEMWQDDLWMTIKSVVVKTGRCLPSRFDGCRVWLDLFGDKRVE